jgi:hypothetical protein
MFFFFFWKNSRKIFIFFERHRHPFSRVADNFSLALWMCVRVHGPEKNGMKDKKSQRLKKIKNSDADGPLTSKIERRRNIFSVWIHFPLMRNTFIDFHWDARRRQEPEKEKSIMTTIHLMLFFRFAWRRKCAEYNSI